MDNQKQTIAHIQAENHKIEADKDIPISYVGWLCTPKRTAGSMVVEFMDAEQANVALQTGLIWDSEYKKMELYNRAYRIQECFRCHKFDHISAQCSGQQKCELCAENYRSEECLSKDLGKWKCVSCGDPHRACDSKCPEFQKEVAQVQMACSNKQTHWKVLSAGVQTPPPPSASSTSPTASHTLTPINAPHTDACTPTPININNPPSAPLKASVVRGLQKAPVIPTPKLKLMLNTNGKRPASPTKTGGNCTPLSIINNNERVKCSITKFLKQQAIEAEAEWERSSRGAAINAETHSEALSTEQESSTITDTVTPTTI